MIKANELRIGNLITRVVLESSHNKKSDLGKRHIETVTSGTIAVIESPFDGLFSFEPIPLTNDWLLRLGFEYAPFQGGMHLEKHKVSFVHEDPATGCLVSRIVFFAHIKYVHQLQNLTFALTGQELTTK